MVRDGNRVCEQPFAEETQNKLDVQDRRGEKQAGKLIEPSAAARVSKCKSAGMPTYVGEWENVLPLRAGWFAAISQQREKAKQPAPSVQVK